MSARPIARYWVPSGTGNPQDVANDVHAMAAGGLGGATYDDVVIGETYDKSQSFGTTAWSNKLGSALQAANKDEFRLDVLISPGWSASSDRVTPDSPGASKVLGHGQSPVVAAGRKFSGQIPLSPVKAGVTKRALQAVIAVRCTGDCTAAPGSPVPLVRSSVVDLTKTVRGTSADGSGQGLTVVWNAPVRPAAGKWLVLAFWSQGNAMKPIASVDGTVRNTYQVDHFSKAGAQALIDPWNQQVLNPKLRSQLRQNGGSMWLDSVELWDTNWTDSFMPAYKARTGQSFVAGLPTVATAQDAAENFYGLFSQTPYVYDDGSNEQYRHDWSNQLNDMFLQNHIDVLKSWAHGLGMTLRYQAYSTVGPKEAVVPEDAWAAVDVPDSEFADARNIAGAAAMAGKKVNNLECCAFIGGLWGQRWSDLMHQINLSFSTGTNRLEYHGFSQSNGGVSLTFPPGDPAASWPGWNPFGFNGSVGEDWSTRQPSWDDESTNINKYIGRNQLVLQSGKLRSDFAIYTPGSFDGETEAIDPSVAANGYSWGYMSDEALLKAPTGNRSLYPNGPGYRALVLNRQSSMPLSSAIKLLAVAKSGVPVIILGSTPTVALGAAGQDPRQNAALVLLMSALKRLPGVVQVPANAANPAAVEAALPNVLSRAGVRPATKPTAPTTLQTITRVDGKTTYHFLYNTSATAAVQTGISLGEGGRPYTLDAWAGTVTPIPVYTRSAGRVSLPIDLKPGESTIIAVTTDEKHLGVKKLRTAITSTNGTVVDKNGQLVVRSTTADTVTSTTDRGQRITTTTATAPAPFRLNQWKLSVQSWHAPTSGLNTVKKNLATITVTAGSDGKLPAWNTITSPVDLRNVSGLGSYKTTYTLPENWNSSMGANVDLGTITDTYKLTVNGHTLEGADQNNTTIDLGPYLHAGKNTLQIRVSTTLLNAVNAAAPAGATTPALQAYGLTGPVTVTPYQDQPLTRHRH